MYFKQSFDLATLGYSLSDLVTKDVQERVGDESCLLERPNCENDVQWQMQLN